MNDPRYLEWQTHSSETLTDLDPQELLREFMRRKWRSFGACRECEAAQENSWKDRRSKMPRTVWCVSRKKR